MIERHITFAVHPDRTDDFERFFTEQYRPPALEMPGLIECSLLREAEHADRYQMVFRWEEAEQAVAWRVSEAQRGAPAGPHRAPRRHGDHGLHEGRIGASAVRIEEVEVALGAAGVVPVITIDDAAQAPGLGAALLAGGLPVAEITFRTDAAAEAIAALRAAVPGVLVGAGTVLDAETVDRALGAGAEFVVAPGLSPAVVERCRERDVAVIPGVATPTEIEAALALGLRLLKLFPAEALGGTRYLDAIVAPYRGVRFVPTGGIGPANLAFAARDPGRRRLRRVLDRHGRRHPGGPMGRRQRPQSRGRGTGLLGSRLGAPGWRLHRRLDRRLAQHQQLGRADHAAHQPNGEPHPGQVRVGDQPRIDELDVPSSRPQPASAGREDVLHPVHVRAVGQDHHPGAIAPEDVDRGAVLGARPATAMGEDREPRQESRDAPRQRVEQPGDRAAQSVDPRAIGHPCLKEGVDRVRMVTSFGERTMSGRVEPSDANRSP